MRMAQFLTQLVGQVCGRTVAKGTPAAEHWLDEPHRFNYRVHVVRCPQHWSEWALRNSEAGRTKVMRDRMKEALAQPEPAFPAYLDPFPVTNKQ